MEHTYILTGRTNEQVEITAKTLQHAMENTYDVIGQSAQQVVKKEIVAMPATTMYQLKSIQRKPGSSSIESFEATLPASEVAEWIRKQLKVSPGFLLFINDDKYWVGPTKICAEHPYGYKRQPYVGKHPYETAFSAPIVALLPTIPTVAQVVPTTPMTHKSIETMSYLDFFSWAKHVGKTEFEWPTPIQDIESASEKAEREGDRAMEREVELADYRYYHSDDCLSG